MSFAFKAIKSLFSSPKPQTAAPVPAPTPVETKATTQVTKDDASIKKAEDDTRRRAARARGRSSTLLTSPTGLLDGETAGRRVVLGG